MNPEKSFYPRPTTDLAALRNGTKYTWGRLVAIHDIGRYTVVESVRDRGPDLEPVPMFSAYVDGRNTCVSSTTMEGALVIALAVGNTADINEAHHNSRCAARILGVEA